MKHYWRAIFDRDEDGAFVCRGPLRSDDSRAKGDLFQAARAGIIFNGRIQHIMIKDEHAERIDFERCYTGYPETQEIQ